MLFNEWILENCNNFIYNKHIKCMWSRTKFGIRHEQTCPFKLSNEPYFSNLNCLVPNCFCIWFLVYTLFVTKREFLKLERVCEISKTAFTIKINVLLFSYGEKSLLYFCNKTIIRFHGWMELVVVNYWSVSIMYSDMQNTAVR